MHFGSKRLLLTLGNIWKYFYCVTGNCQLLIALFLPRCTSEYTAERDHLNARLAIKASHSWLTSRSTIWYTQERSPTSVRYVTHTETAPLGVWRDSRARALLALCAQPVWRAAWQTGNCSGFTSMSQLFPALVCRCLWNSMVAFSLLGQHLPDTVLPSPHSKCYSAIFKIEKLGIFFPRWESVKI